MDGMFSLEPLLAIWRDKHQMHLARGCPCTDGGCCASAESFAREIGVSHSTIRRRIQTGWISDEEADQWSCAIGLSAATVWRGDWDRSIEEPDPEPLEHPAEPCTTEPKRRTRGGRPSGIPACACGAYRRPDRPMCFTCEMMAAEAVPA